ncbi:MAG TPA: SUMF1/EgtB/PvdO family nonheme iron enzyme [Bacteroidia bacterium]|jgi:hypothetical protein
MPDHWGFLRVNDTLEVEESEILVGEWFDYMCYHDFKKFPNYIKFQQLNQSELKELLNEEIDRNLLPAHDILSKMPYSWILEKPADCNVIKFSSFACMVVLPFKTDSLSNSESLKRLKSLLHLPVTGISYEQATAFCKWRTELDSIRLWRQLSDLPPVPKFIIRLPTAFECDLLNPNMDSLTKKKEPAFNYHAQFLHNGKEYKRTVMDAFSFSASQNPLSKDARNLQGNAAEMTNVKGIAKGGSYAHWAFYSYPGRVINYESPEPWLGFRCICEQRKKSKRPN